MKKTPRPTRVLAAVRSARAVVGLLLALRRKQREVFA
jgi:hypothetical protein